MLRYEEDAFGRAYEDVMNGGPGELTIERDDGSIDEMSVAGYFEPFETWAPFEQQAIALARGRVLDIGCGPGRHLLYLQEKGHEVVGIDNSPIACEVARKRGARDTRAIELEEIGPELGMFDTVLMLGNNFGLVGDPPGLKRFLNVLDVMTSPDALIIGGLRDPYQTDDPAHLAFHQRNRDAGRMSGQARIRAICKDSVGPWIGLLFLSREELAGLLEGTAWEVRQVFGEGACYAAGMGKRRL